MAIALTPVPKPPSPYDEYISKEIAPFLKARGFRRRRRLFTRRVGENLQMIDLGTGAPGKSGTRSTHYSYRAGVPLGVYYGALREFDVFSPRLDLLKEGDCHWRSVMMWQPLTFGADLRVWLETDGLPLLDRLTDETSAMESWRSGPVDGLGETNRRLWLAIDLARRGESGRLLVTLNELERMIAELREIDAKWGTKEANPFVARIEATARRAREIAGLPP